MYFFFVKEFLIPNTVFMDNYYTSAVLSEELVERKTLACGTVRSNKSGLPKEICEIKEKKGKQLKYTRY